MSRGQKWGTVGVEKGTFVRAWVHKDKKVSVERLASLHKLTVSALINKLLSIELVKAGLPDDSFSVEL